MKRTTRGSIVVGTLLAGGCGPGTEPSEPTGTDPVSVAPADAAPASAPAVDAGAATGPVAPADPLAGMTAEQRWRWAVERLPELAGLEQAPGAPGYDRWVGETGGTLLLHAATLFGHRLEQVKGYKACSPMLFKLDKDQLLTRLPLNGKPAQPDYEGDHVAITMGIEVSHVVVKGKEHTPGAACAARPLLRQSSRDVIRFDAVEAQYLVQCTDHGRRLCEHGTPGCTACPPDPARPDQAALEKVVREHSFLRSFEGGEAFYRDRAACLDAARAKPGPRAEGTAHGFPLHQHMQLVCSQHVLGAPGAGGAVLEIDWSLYATPLAPAKLADWYRARLGAALVAGKGEWTAKLPSADAPERVLTIAAPGAPGPTCGDDAPAGSKALVRISTAIRR